DYYCCSYAGRYSVLF
nr:immunoglobulin light chain junction region [Macaca mulatta]MOW03452.1 immunoglobulin light chain junction region [Macaca mulatta]